MTEEKVWTAEEQKVHRAELVAALRGDKYRQGRARLNRDGKMCCLAVACDISGLGDWRPDEFEEGQSSYHIGDVAAAYYLPSAVQHWLGFKTNKGKYDGGPTDGLAGDNDELGKNFAQIADIIESEPEGLIAPVQS